jgi:hypothetical protein
MGRGQELAPGEDHVGVVIEYPERSDAAAAHYSHVELPRLLVSLLSVWRCHKLTYSQNPSILLHCAQSSAWDMLSGLLEFVVIYIALNFSSLVSHLLHSFSPLLLQQVRLFPAYWPPL